jgi:hypothetical protein
MVWFRVMDALRQRWPNIQTRHQTCTRLCRKVSALWLIALFLTGCAQEFMVFHSQTGDPLILSRRSYSSDGCLKGLHEDATRIGVTLRYVHIRGTMVGRSLLWPFEPGYACEAAIGPEHPPSGTYPLDLNALATVRPH